ncbi:MmgE/PrpD family protein [Phaeobacter marinintestinus]|uniref:MmgE/PrpD family protein n=1 Tax=Falsiphaeobacter marinintestinus TaxID=1492905 RepID=UPI0011B57866|nr:MmgE/PrpD family protein [Phaeobacter marinintestinus]
MTRSPDPTDDLCVFLTELTFAQIPTDVVAGIKLLFIDWLGSALAGAGTGPADMFQGFAARMGPGQGSCTDYSGGPDTSGFFAAMINAATSHVVEQDDLHNSSVLHPATVVFPAVLAIAQQEGATGAEMLTAAVAGYEAGIRVGEFLGRSHYVHFHTTATAGTLAAAAASARLLNLDAEQTRHALGTAGTKAAGLWEFLVDGADSKQIHTASAASSGLLAAYAARDGITGARRIFDGAHGMGAAMSTDSDPSFLNDRLGERWATLETSYKWHASCRHTHPAADALLKAIHDNGLDPKRITSVQTHVHQGAIDVLGPVVAPTTIHQSKFSMGTVLGLLAMHGKAGLTEFDSFALTDPDVARYRKIVTMTLDPEIDAAYPARWIGKVTVTMDDGTSFNARVDTPKGDPGNMLSLHEITNKAMALAAYGGREDPVTVERWIGEIQNLDAIEDGAGALRRA